MLSFASKTTAALLLAFACVAAVPEKASAQPGPGPVTSATITNNSPIAVNYQIAGQNGQWSSYSLAPGQSMNHFVGIGYPLYIRFDQGNGFFATYTLQTWNVADRFQSGRPYSFVVDGSGFIQLYAS
jgi:hypothetical protein